MKKIGIIIMFSLIILQVFSQEVMSREKQDKKQSVSVSDDSTKVTIGNNILSVLDRKDAVKIRVGNRGLNILESLEGPKVAFEKFTDNENVSVEDDQDQGEDRNRRRSGFRGHWSGIEFGFNNYMTADNSFVMPDDIYYMTLHSNKSNNFNINFSQLSLGFSRNIGIVTGLGINWNNYRFDANNNIIKTDAGIIEELDPGVPLEKSKLTTIYLHIPALLEIHLPFDRHKLQLAAGPIGAIKLGSYTKMVYQDSGQKLKTKGDFSLNMIRYGATAHIGFENFHIYGTYYKMPLFKTGKGPGGYDLYPFEIGFAFTFND